MTSDEENFSREARKGCQERQKIILRVNSLNQQLLDSLSALCVRQVYGFFASQDDLFFFAAFATLREKE
jgi:hypothetical protein